MYRKIKDFQQEWKLESEITIELFSAVSQSSLDIQLHPQVRTLRNLMIHISRIPLVIFEELDFSLKISALEKQPHTPLLLAENYKHISEAVLNYVTKKWDDKKLKERYEILGESVKLGRILSSQLISHTVHHRGQMATIMRQLDLKLPSFYGPNRDEWLDSGEEPVS